MLSWRGRGLGDLGSESLFMNVLADTRMHIRDEMSPLLLLLRLPASFRTSLRFTAIQLFTLRLNISSLGSVTDPVPFLRSSLAFWIRNAHLRGIARDVR